MRKKATKIGAFRMGIGEYGYRGFVIIKAGPRCWNVINPEGCCHNAGSTLREAKSIVDSIIQQQTKKRIRRTGP